MTQLWLPWCQRQIYDVSTSFQTGFSSHILLPVNHHVHQKLQIAQPPDRQLLRAWYHGNPPSKPSSHAGSNIHSQTSDFHWSHPHRWEYCHLKNSWFQCCCWQMWCLEERWTQWKSSHLSFLYTWLCRSIDQTLVLGVQEQQSFVCGAWLWKMSGERERECACACAPWSILRLLQWHSPSDHSLSLLLFVLTKTKSPNFLELSLVQAAPRLWGINKDLGHFASSFWREKKSLKTAKVLSIIIHFALDSQKGFFSDRSNISWHLERAFFNGTKKKWNPFGIDCCCQSWWVSFCHSCCIRWDCTRQRCFKKILYWIREGMCKQRAGKKKTDLQKNLRKRVGEACDWREKRKPPLPRKWIAFLPYFPFFLSLSFWNKP